MTPERNYHEDGETVELIPSGYEWFCPDCTPTVDEYNLTVITCPHCGAVIDHLTHVGYETLEYDVRAYEKHPEWDLDYVMADVLDSKSEEPYLCPECQEVLAADHEEAEKILRGGTLKVGK